MRSSQIVGRGLKIAYPISIEKEYTKLLLRFVSRLKRLSIDSLVENYDLQTSLNGVVRHDDVVDDLGQSLRVLGLTISIESKEVIQSLGGYFSKVQQFTNRSLNNSVKHLVSKVPETELATFPAAVQTIEINTLKKMWVNKNVDLIKGLSDGVLNQLGDAVYDAARMGESIQSLSKRLNADLNINKKKAKAIARDQISKLKGNLSRHNDLVHGLTTYEWSTCKDGAVRSSHRVLEGKICSWLDASIYKNHIKDKWKKRASIGGAIQQIGEDFGCRCTNISIAGGL